MKTVLISTAATIALCAAAPAWADDQTAPTPDVAGQDAAKVSELVVTATRSAQPADHIGQSVTVLSAADLKAAQAVIVSDLLASTPGVSFTRNGGVGAATSVRIRGAETGQTVVVIDGVKLNDPSSTDSGYNFANLLAGDVARIEVLRGAQSTLWGSQAIGGVVNIVTADPTEPFQGSATLEGGSLGTAYARAAAGGVVERLTWRIAASQYSTSGISAYAKGAEKDGYRNTGLSGRARVALTDDVSLDLRAVWSKGRNEFDGFPAPAYVFADDPEYGRTEDLVAYAGLNFALFDQRLKNRIAFGSTTTDRDNYDPTQAVTTRTFDARGENRRWEYQGAFAITEAWTATFGAETEKASMRTASPSAFDPNPTAARAKAGTDSVYAQVIGPVAPGLTLTAGIRHDSHDTFGDHTLGQLAAAWSLNDGATVLRGSWGQGFKAPSLYQLFSDYGNAGLAPEKADSWDAGVTQRLGKATVSATWFQRDTTDQIDFVSCTGTSTVPLCSKNGVHRFGYYDNIARAKAHGVELTGAVTLAGVDLSANYSWTDTENGSAGANHGKKLARRPEHQTNLQAAYVWGNKLSTSVAVHYVGDSYDNAANSYVLSARTLVDLRASYPLSDRLEVYGRVENALDESYQTTRNYGSIGRAAYVGLRASF
ncbi:TonB-dependent receptor plug domain-containing protein [Phenylobacterium aquaticum]|uniref:TonB-dependent receptor plug domain-containing protein n=1 Tax=Phenylobacterium aquaticum TaxID=1763816 RepID=UPI001F5E31BB|nr:TonB-dependent receptor [Phenylobacterium aquaticum]MCI3132471.1 TonB-dependent receptor [Phenylobacterium aquaticum]